MIERIFQLMKETKTTAYQLSKNTGIPNTTISSWKNGKSSPNVEAIAKLAEYFGLTADYLITGKDRENVLKQMPQNSEINCIYEKLNFENKNKLLGYADGLLSQQNKKTQNKAN